MTTVSIDTLRTDVAAWNAHRRRGGEIPSLRGANLTGADLAGANLTEADLTRANLTEADLSWADLSWANLTGVNLSRANLTGADLTRANLTGANLGGADLSWADLSGADLSRANLGGVKGFHLLPVGDPRGYSFVHAVLCKDGEWRIRAGCRFGTIAEARKHSGENYAGERWIGDMYLHAIDWLEGRIADGEG